jgi:caffeoyl-CoA O-methyltransferase
VAPRSFLLTESQARYIVEHSTGPDELLSQLIDETQALGPPSGMQIAPEQGTLLMLLTQWVGTTSALELGTFTGYSSICIARGLASGGRLLCCDVSEEWTSVARRYWEAAGLAERIDLRLAPATQTLRALEPGTSFDFVFIDADKPAYPDYWELVVPLVRPGGAIVVDNVLRQGEVWDPSVMGEGTVAIRRFNDIVAADPRVDVVFATIADGLVLARRREGET